MDYQTQFLKKMETNNKIRSKNTLINYRTGINKFHQQFPDISVLKFRDIDKWFIEMQYSPGYKNQLLTTISKYLDTLAKWEVIDPEVAKNVAEIKKDYYTKGSLIAQKSIPSFTDRQLDTFFKLLLTSKRNYKRMDQYLLTAGLMLFCGYRINEPFLILKDNIEFVYPAKKYYIDGDPAKGRDYPKEAEKNIAYAKIRIPTKDFKWKYGPGENIRYLHEFCTIQGHNLFALLKKVADYTESDYLLPVVRNGETYGSKQTPKHFSRLIRSLVKKAGFSQYGLSSHSFRKTFANRNDSLPNHIVAVMLAQETDLPVTEIYQKSGRNEQKWWEIAQRNLITRD